MAFYTYSILPISWIIIPPSYHEFCGILPIIHPTFWFSITHHSTHFFWAFYPTSNHEFSVAHYIASSLRFSWHLARICTKILAIYLLYLHNNFRYNNDITYCIYTTILDLLYLPSNQYHLFTLWFRFIHCEFNIPILFTQQFTFFI